MHRPSPNLGTLQVVLMALDVCPHMCTFLFPQVRDDETIARKESQTWSKGEGCVA